MKWILILAAVAAAGAAWAQETGQPQAPRVRRPNAAVITNPDWVHKPSPDEFSSHWPAGVSEGGVAKIECEVTTQGTLTGCVVLGEEPLGKGFGKAALEIAQYFRMKPKTIDGKPVGGGTFQTNIRFNWSEPAPDWVHQPTDAELLSVWPEKARGVQGFAVLVCDIDSKGEAHHCNVNRESPKGMGFGEAALKLAPVVRLTPGAQTGILIPINFIPPQPKQTGAASYGNLSAMTTAPWQTAPVSADLVAAWPKSAPAGLTEAHVRLSCPFNANGTLGQCAILSEDPPGLGFGAAALTLASRFSLRSGVASPEQLAKARVILPITFTNPALGPQSPALLAKPDWVTFVTAERVVELYPTKAADAGVKTGRGVVVCTVAAGGVLTGCTVESEDPPGLGFGDSAVQVMAAFTVNPWTEEGHPVDGSKVRVPVRMNEAEPAPQAAPPPKAGG
jgi:TonB family protein